MSEETNPLSLSDQGKRVVDSDEERRERSIYDDADEDGDRASRRALEEDEEEEEQSPINSINRLIKPMYWSWLSTNEAVSRIPQLQINILNKVTPESFDLMRDLFPLNLSVKDVSSIHDRMSADEVNTFSEMMPNLPAIIRDCIKIEKVASFIQPFVSSISDHPLGTRSQLSRPVHFGFDDDDDDDDDDDFHRRGIDDDDDDDKVGVGDDEIDETDALMLLKRDVSLAIVSLDSNINVLREVSDELLQTLKRTKCVTLEDLDRYPVSNASFLAPDVALELERLKSRISPFIRFLRKRSRAKNRKALRKRGRIGRDIDDDDYDIGDGDDDDDDYRLDRRNLRDRSNHPSRKGSSTRFSPSDRLLGSKMGSGMGSGMGDIWPSSSPSPSPFSAPTPENVSGFMYCSREQLEMYRETGITSPFVEFNDFLQLSQQLAASKQDPKQEEMIKRQIENHSWRLRFLTYQDDVQNIVQRPPTDLDVFQYLSARLQIYFPTILSPLEKIIAKYSSTGSIPILNESIPRALWEESFVLDQELYASNPLFSRRFEVQLEIDLAQIEKDFLSDDPERLKDLIPIPMIDQKKRDVKGDPFLPRLYLRSDQNNYINTGMITYSRYHVLWDNYCPGVANPFAAIAHYLLFLPEMRIPPRYIKSVVFLRDS